MAAAVLNITIEQGATFTRTLTVKDSGGDEIDITGWTLRGQVRANQFTTDILASFTGTVDPDQVTNKGMAALTISATDTAAIASAKSLRPTLKNSTFIYDVEVEKPGGEVVRLLQGQVTFVPEITR